MSTTVLTTSPTTVRPVTVRPVAARTSTHRIQRPGGTARIVLTLIVANLRGFVREPMGFVMQFLYPLFMLLIFHAVFPGTITGGVSYAQYLLPAMLTTGVMTTCLQNLATDVAAEREQGALRRLQVLPAPTWSYVLGKVVSNTVLAAANAVMLITVARLGMDIDLPTTTHAWLLFLTATVLMVGTCTSLGLAIGRTRPSARAASALVTPVSLILQFVSGIFFPLSQLPSWMVHSASVFPARWSAELMREAFLPSTFQVAEPTGAWETGKGLVVLTAWLVAAVAAAVVISRRDAVDR